MPWGGVYVGPVELEVEHRLVEIGPHVLIRRACVGRHAELRLAPAPCCDLALARAQRAGPTVSR